MATIKDIFQEAIIRKASDVHLVVDMPAMLRIDGELIDLDEKKLSKKEVEILVLSLLSPEQKKVFLENKELDFGYEANDLTRFRINVHFEKGNMGLVARVISNITPTMESLDIPEVIYKLLDVKQGLILVTGPTGCGKSSSLAAMVNYINSKYRYHIITLEDPIEYVFKPKNGIIIQRQLGSDMLNFSEGLKHALRQDPNVVMVGEMRDLETIAATITLAETGHLVLATLHTYSAAQTIDRIIDIFPPHQQNQIRMQLSITLASVISQRLLPKQGGGRVAAREILINTPAVGNIIRENKIAQLKTVIETSAKDGMISMDNDIKRLYNKGLITKEAAQTQMENPEVLEKFKPI